MPDQSDLSRVALRTLEDALANAEFGPVAHQWGYRLALTWLMRGGIAQPWQCRAFWQAMTDPFAFLTTEEQRRDHRRTAMIAYLDNWHRAAGVTPPDCLQRHHWSDALASPIDSPDQDGELTRMSAPNCCASITRGQRRFTPRNRAGLSAYRMASGCWSK